MNPEQLTKLGEAVIALLNLKQVSSGVTGKRYNPPRYATSWGTKTAQGIGACVERLVKEARV